MSRNFNGSTSVIECGVLDDILQENQPLTIGAWIKPFSIGELSDSRIVARNTQTAGSGVGISMTTTSTFLFFIGGATTLLNIAVNNAITFGIWNFISATHDGSTTGLNSRLYVNAVQQASRFSLNGVGINDNVADMLRIGNEDAATRTFDGDIAHVQVFDRVLSISEIRQIMFSPGSVRNGLRRYYPLYGYSTSEPDLAGIAGPLANGVITNATLSSDPPIPRTPRILRRNINTRYNTVSGAVTYTKDLSDSITLSESITKDTLKFISQSITLSESQSKDVLKILTQAITISESIIKNDLKVLSDSATLSESKVFDFLKILSQSIILTESNCKDILKVLSESLSLTESQIKDFLKILTNSMTLTELQNVSLAVIARALITFLARGIIDTHDEIQMTHDLSLTGAIKKDLDEAQIDTDRISWDFHNS